MKVCTRCFRVLELDEFFRRVRGAVDGRMSYCKDCDYKRKLANGSLREEDGRWKHGDPHATDVTSARKRQAARQRVYMAVRRGILPPARSRTCADCGDQAKHYDHFRGYDGAHALDVEAVCTRCHGLRARERGEMAGNTGGHRRERV